MRRARRGAIVLGTTLGLCATARADAQQCAATRARVAPAAYSGLRIGGVEVSSRAPEARSAIERLVSGLHVATRESRIRRELLFAPGDTVDTLRVAESLRRLRSLGFLDDVVLEARRCGEAPVVDLHVVTRDAWSTTPEVKVRSASTAVGVSERNVLGTGVGVRFALQAGASGAGILATARLPALPDPTLLTELGTVRFADGNASYASVGTRNAAAGAAWTVFARGATSEREPRATPGLLLDRSSATLLVGRRLAAASPERAAAIYALAGAEMERADVVAAMTEPVLGARTLHRRYAGLDAGVARVSTRYDALSWLLPRGGIVDVPRGTEGELVLGLGRDGQTGAPATHWDAWAGRAISWPASGTLLLGDVWTSGFAGGDLLSTSTVRAALTARRRAPGGSWTARLAGERLGNPDPDVRALATLDPVAPTLPPLTRFAETALAASVERGWRLAGLTRSIDLGGALFTAGSYRWDPTAAVHREELGVGVVGLGLRLDPSHSARASVRLDLGFPVVHSGVVRNRPYVALSVVPWPFDGRRRDGRNLP